MSDRTPISGETATPRAGGAIGGEGAGRLIAGPPRKTELLVLLEETLAYARDRSYTGWDYNDGLSSRILRVLPVGHRWVNLAFQETIKRSPVNLRPLFLVEQRRNRQGAALFALANLAAYRQTDETLYAAEGRALVDWLVEHQSRGYSGFCIGYAHPNQGLSKKSEPLTPGVVGTAPAVMALLRADEVLTDATVPGRSDSYADVARTAADFVFDDLAYTPHPEIDGAARIHYRVDDAGEHYTLNANALGAWLLAELYGRFGEERFLEPATAILNYVVARQADAGGWPYRDPPEASHLSMDNHHNGFVLDALLGYRKITGSSQYDDAIERALRFYRETLFDPDGTPNWDEATAYPKDIHACAQGILTFTRAGDLDFATRILEWTLENLYAGNGRFYYRKGRFYTRRFTLMRWCQAWMAYAVSVYLDALDGE